ncbi:hypothetical protein KIPB_002174 [Kipferlia bialata]|uniref:Uncharacterized protein n=1 Tax=Kipferlia bialata TaxID=797122 RepID=A0A9K3CRE4_9EUKA|nr:hypothetical protein KIPB_002174 [Kipferlia bialata]|eukprot:g2174.t1
MVDYIYTYIYMCVCVCVCLVAFLIGAAKWIAILTVTGSFMAYVYDTQLKVYLKRTRKSTFQANNIGPFYYKLKSQ